MRLATEKMTILKKEEVRKVISLDLVAITYKSNAFLLSVAKKAVVKVVSMVAKQVFNMVVKYH